MTPQSDLLWTSLLQAGTSNGGVGGFKLQALDTPYA